MARKGFTEVSIDQNYLTMLDGNAYRWFDNQTLASSAVKEYLILTPPEPYDLFFYGRVFNGRRTDMQLEVFVNPTFTSEGTSMANRVFNRNGTSPNTPLGQVWQDPVLTDDGTLVDYDSVAGSKGSGQGSAGSESSQEFPRIITPSTYLLVRITNLSGTDSGDFTYKIFWSEIERN